MMRTSVPSRQRADHRDAAGLVRSPKKAHWPSAGVVRSQGRDLGAVALAATASLGGYDFTQIPIHAGTKGEGSGDEEIFSPLKGEPGAVAVEEPAIKGESATTKKVRKTELAPPVAGNCGAYSWRVKFSVDNADAKTNGYIVQKINVIYTRKDCSGKDKPVTGVGKFPYWEAWGVRNGKVFIGDTDLPHNADTYADDEMGNFTSGSIAIEGAAEFFSGAKLPADMKANNPDTQARSLRSSITDPGLTGGTGSIAHDLTASWKCCGSGPLLPGAAEKKTTFSNKR